MATNKGLFGKNNQNQQQVRQSEEPGKALRIIKVLEDKISNIDKKTELIENNILSVNKRQNVELKTLHSKILDVEKELTEVKRKIIELASDLKNFARLEEVETIRKYLDLWEPLNFVTRKEIEEIIEEKLEKFK